MPILRVPPRTVIALIAGALMAGVGSPLPHVSSHAIPRHTTASPDGPLVVIDQRGQRSAQVQIGAGQDEIVAVQGGTTRILARALTTPCCSLGGLAPSPRGRYVAFSQEAIASPRPAPVSAGLWVVTSAGSGLRHLIAPPSQVSPVEGPLGIGPVAWSPDRYTLAYAVNASTDTPIGPRDVRRQGLWLTPYTAPHPRQVVRSTGLGSAFAACHQATPLITALSWAPDARTVAVSAECGVPAPTPGAAGRVVRAVVALDVASGQARTLVVGGGDAALSPVDGRLAYVTGERTGGPTTLWGADAAGSAARPLTSSAAQISSPTWSPDGQAIAFLVGPQAGHGATIDLIDVATGRRQIVLSATRPGLPAGGYFARLAWMPLRS